MSYLVGILGLLVVFGLAYLLSNNRKEIAFKSILILFIIQIVMALVMFKTAVGIKVVEAVSNFVTLVLSYGYEGIEFVTGGLVVVEGGSVFFINVLMLIIFSSTILSILTYIKVLPLTIKYLGGALARITGLSNIITFNSVSSIFFGQSEALLAIKAHLHSMSENKLFIVCTSAMASVSASIMGAYLTMVPAEYVLSAMVLNAISGLIIGSIIAPSKRDKDESINIKEVSQSDSIFGAISAGALDGGKVALIVAAMLVAYVGLMAVINGAFNALFNISFTEILGYIFAPVAWIMGIPASEIVTAGSIMGMKLATNEFVAMLQFLPLIETLNPKTVGIVSTFLISFANFSSIGIISGSIQAINADKAKQVEKFGLKLLLSATLVSILTATMVGLVI